MNTMSRSMIWTCALTCAALTASAVLAGPLSPPTEGLDFWIRADSLSLSNGDSVSSWTDEGLADGVAQNATQSSSGAQPTYFASVPGLNGLPAVYFDGGDRLGFDRSAIIGPSNSSDHVYGSTIFVVGQRDSGAFLGLYWPTANRRTFRFYGDDFYFGGTTSATDAGRGSSMLLTTEFAVYAGLAKEDELMKVYKNGDEPDIYDRVFYGGTPLSLPLLTNGYSSTQNAAIGALSSGTAYATSCLTGMIAEVLIYDYALDAATFNEVQTYLNAKYGLVPEPSTLMLLVPAMGLLGMGAYGRRRRW